MGNSSEKTNATPVTRHASCSRGNIFETSSPGACCLVARVIRQPRSVGLCGLAVDWLSANDPLLAVAQLIGLDSRLVYFC